MGADSGKDGSGGGDGEEGLHQLNKIICLFISHMQFNSNILKFEFAETVNIFIPGHSGT